MRITMLKKKQPKVWNSETLGERSNILTEAFTTLIAGLKQTNEDAQKVMASNADQIRILTEENAAIETQTEKNTKIIQNVENLLSV